MLINNYFFNYLTYQNSIMYNQVGLLFNYQLSLMSYWLWDMIGESDILNNLLPQYWAWTINKPKKEIADYNKMPKVENSEEVRKKINMRHLINEVNFEFKAEALMNSLTSKSIKRGILIPGKAKSKPKYGPLSYKRSSYIGVMKNGENWQAFITAEEVFSKQV